jgi:hypothetical protein
MGIACCRLNLIERLCLAVSWSARQLSSLLFSDTSSFLSPIIQTKGNFSRVNKRNQIKYSNEGENTIRQGRGEGSGEDKREVAEA